jgi:signal peptidase II
VKAALRARLPYAGLIASVVALDQVTKALVNRFFTLHDAHPVIEGILDLTYVRNRGGAFGVLNTADLPHKEALFAGLSLLALAAIAAYAWWLPASQRLSRSALALILGGAVGNLIDRLRFGYVVDFIDVYWRSSHWPAFNAADSAITVGIALLVIDMLRTPAAATSGPESLEAAPPQGRAE